MLGGAELVLVRYNLEMVSAENADIIGFVCPVYEWDIPGKFIHHCHGCNACVAYCPTKAIQFKIPQAYKELGTLISKILCLPEKRKRYHHPCISAKDLMIDRKEINLSE